ncbi:MAG: hypothetical protein AB1742_15915 [bacterium]
MERLKLYIETSLLNFLFADDAPLPTKKKLLEKTAKLKPEELVITGEIDEPARSMPKPVWFRTKPAGIWFMLPQPR